MSPSSKLESQIDLHVTMSNNIKESPIDNEEYNIAYPQDLPCGYPRTSTKLQILNTINFLVCQFFVMPFLLEISYLKC
jgi:hypothetical protein